MCSNKCDWVAIKCDGNSRHCCLVTTISRYSLGTIIVLSPCVVPQPAGIGSMTIAVPNQAALAGVPFYTQAVLDQQPVQVRLTNVVGDITLR